MQDSQLRWMVGLSIVVLVLVGLLSIEPSDPESVGQITVLQVADPASVVAVDVVRPDSEVRLSRDGETWNLAGEGGGLADSEAVMRLIDDLQEGSSATVLENPGGLEEYGLDPLVADVTLRFEDGSQQRIQVGDPAPTGWRTYVLGEDGAVLTIPSKPGEWLNKERSAFLDRRVLRVDPSRVRRVWLDGPDGRLEVSGEGRHWWLDGFTRADEDAVDDLVMGLLDLRFDSVMTSLQPIAEPQRQAGLMLEDGTTVTLAVGDQTPMGTLVEGPHAIGMVYPESLALLAQGPTDIGDARAIPLDAMRDDRLVIRMADRSWEAIRQTTGWQVVPSEEDAGEVVRAVVNARIRYTPEPIPEVGEPWFTAEVWRGDDVAKVAFSRPVAGLMVGQDQRGGAAYLVADDSLAMLADLPR